MCRNIIISYGVQSEECRGQEVSVVAGWGGAAGGVGRVLAGLQGAVGPVWRGVEDRAGGDVVVDHPGQCVAGVEPAGQVVVPALSHLVTAINTLQQSQLTSPSHLSLTTADQEYCWLPGESLLSPGPGTGLPPQERRWW